LGRLKREHRSLEARLEKTGKDRLPTVLRLSERLEALMDEIGSTREKEKTLWNPAAITRFRIAKKGFELSKELKHFEEEVAGEFVKGNVPEEAGKRFISIARLIEKNKIQSAKDEFGYFEEIIGASRRYGEVGEELKGKEMMLQREKTRMEKIMAEMSGLEKVAIDQEKVRRYDELTDNIAKLKTLREGYLDSLLSMPVIELIREIGKHSPEDYFQEFPAKEEMEGLERFFSDYPAFGRCDARELCGSFAYSEKKLSHICPETTRFRKAVLGNRRFFETLSALKHTAFLAVDDSDDKVLDFYAANIASAEGIVSRIRELRKEKLSDKEEHERSERIGKRKAELSKYSKAGLEAELKEIEHLLGILHSETQKKDPDGGGLLSGFGLFLKKISGPPRSPG